MTWLLAHGWQLACAGVMANLFVWALRERARWLALERSMDAPALPVVLVGSGRCFVRDDSRATVTLP